MIGNALHLSPVDEFAALLVLNICAILARDMLINDIPTALRSMVSKYHNNFFIFVFTFENMHSATLNFYIIFLNIHNTYSKNKYM